VAVSNRFALRWVSVSVSVSVRVCLSHAALVSLSVYVSALDVLVLGSVSWYGVATIRRLLKIIDLFCRI